MLKDEEVTKLLYDFPELEDPYYPRRVLFYEEATEFSVIELFLNDVRYLVVNQPNNKEVWYEI